MIKIKHSSKMFELHHTHNNKYQKSCDDCEWNECETNEENKRDDRAIDRSTRAGKFIS